MTKEEKFLNDYIPIAVNAEKESGISAEIILAQAALEGDFGTSYGVKNRKNHFGITAFGSKNKYWDGSYSTSSVSGLKFRIYKTHEDSFNDFARLIKSKYQECYKNSTNIPQYASCIANSAYISELNGDNRQQYEASVKKYANKFKPKVEAYKKQTSRKKILTIVVVSVTLLAIATALIYSINKSKQK